MKLLLLLIPLIISPVFAQPLSDMTGLKTRSDIVLDGKSFEIETVANFDVQSVVFENGKLIFHIISPLQNNFGELQIPQNLTKGNLNFYVDGKEIEAKILQNDRISFATVEFTGNGTHTLEITSDYLQTIKSTQEITTNTEEFDQLTTIIVIAIIVSIVGVVSTMKFYIKKKTKTKITQ